MAGSEPDFLRDFLEHCLRGTNHATGRIGTPLDFVSFHAKGSPTSVDGHVRMGIATQLQTIDHGFGIVASFPETKRLPIVIGESDPEGCAACQGPRFAYRNGTMYSSYTAASFARKHDLAAQHGVNLEGASTWAFEFEDQPYFAGFRALASNGIDLPVLNVFRMFSRMTGQRVLVESSGAVPLDAIVANGVRGAADVSALASRDARPPRGHGLALPRRRRARARGRGDAARSDGLPASAREATLTHERIDDAHSNAYAAWKRMGSPVAPTREQYQELKAKGALTPLEPPTRVPLVSGTATLRFSLPRQAVSLLVLEWSEPAPP